MSINFAPGRLRACQQFSSVRLFSMCACLPAVCHGCWCTLPPAAILSAPDPQQPNLQSFFTDLKSLKQVSGLNSGIYSALTAGFVLAGLTYIGLPSQSLTAVFGTAAEKGLEDVFLWQLIGNTPVMHALEFLAHKQTAWWSTHRANFFTRCDTASTVLHKPSPTSTAHTLPVLML